MEVVLAVRRLEAEVQSPDFLPGIDFLAWLTGVWNAVGSLVANMILTS